MPGPSCVPPTQESSFLQVGTPDANGAGANSVGTVKITVTSTPDVVIKASITDVRCKPATAATVCNSPTAADGPDYAGQLRETRRSG